MDIPANTVPARVKPEGLLPPMAAAAASTQPEQGAYESGKQENQKSCQASRAASIPKGVSAHIPHSLPAVFSVIGAHHGLHSPGGSLVKIENQMGGILQHVKNSYRRLVPGTD